MPSQKLPMLCSIQASVKRMCTTAFFQITVLLFRLHPSTLSVLTSTLCDQLFVHNLLSDPAGDLFAVSVVGCLLGYSSCLVVWIPLFLDPSDGVFGRFDLAALCGCRTLNFCLFVCPVPYCPLPASAQTGPTHPKCPPNFWINHYRLLQSLVHTAGVTASPAPSAALIV